MAIRKIVDANGKLTYQVHVKVRDSLGKQKNRKRSGITTE